MIFMIGVGGGVGVLRDGPLRAGSWSFLDSDWHLVPVSAYLYNIRVKLFYISKLGLCDLNQRDLKGKFALTVSWPMSLVARCAPLL